MLFDYFYGQQAEQFKFYRIPKVLFTDSKFSDISTEAKVLYGLMLDRNSLSIEKKWLDKLGRVYIIYTLEQIQNDLRCGDRKASKMMSELETAGLIERKRQGQGKPNLIYVKNFISSEEKTVQNSENDDSADKAVDTSSDAADEKYGTDTSESHVQDGGLSEDSESSETTSGCGRFRNRQNNDSGVVETADADSSKSRRSITEISNTDGSDTDPFLSVPEVGNGTEGKEEQIRACIEDYFKEQLSFETLLYDRPEEKEKLNAILGLLVDTCCSRRKTIRIAGDDKPISVVESQFMKLTGEHIRFVLRCMSENTTRIYNMKQYLLATLYNAPLTMDSYYSSLVNHHMAEGNI